MGVPGRMTVLGGMPDNSDFLKQPSSPKRTNVVALNNENGRESDRETLVTRYANGEFEELTTDPRGLRDPDSSAWITVVDANPGVDGECVIHMQSLRKEMFIVCDRRDLSKAMELIDVGFQVTSTAS